MAQGVHLGPKALEGATSRRETHSWRREEQTQGMGRADTDGAPWARSIIADKIGKAGKGPGLGTAADYECGFYFRFTGKPKNGFR